MTPARKSLIAVVGALGLTVGTLSAIAGVSTASALQAQLVAAAAAETATSEEYAEAEESWPSDDTASDDTATDDEASSDEMPSDNDPAGSSEEATEVEELDELAAETDVTMVDWADGESATTSTDETVWGGYPAATATVWTATEGLISGETLSEGSVTVAAQRDLDIKNPTYAEGEINTWWVWAPSDAGTWDWYPATALAEGASGQPINGIALAE